MNNRKNDRLVFQIGFSHCGTHSIHYLFQDSGVEGCAHYVRPKNNVHLAIIMNNNFEKDRHPIFGMDELSVFTDMQYRPSAYEAEDYYPYTDFFKRFYILESFYPNAKFILNIRPVSRWIKTRSNFELKTGRLLEEDVKKWTDLKIAEFERHIENVIDYFGPSSNLIIFDIEKSDPQRLVDFFPEFKLDVRNWRQHNKTL